MFLVLLNICFKFRALFLRCNLLFQTIDKGLQIIRTDENFWYFSDIKKKWTETKPEQITKNKIRIPYLT